MTSKPASILIVEDERIVAKDIQQTLQGFGYQVLPIAASAEEAIASATGMRPDLVLMDIRIKGERDGIATAEALRKELGIPIIYLTAHADDTTLERAKRTEPYGYLLKPIKAAELRSAIEVSLYKHETEVRLRERERWFATTLRSIADAVISIDLTGSITFMNPAAAAILGLAEQSAAGKAIGEVLRLVDSDERPLEPDPLVHVLGEGRAVHLAEVGLRDGAGNPIGVVSHSTAPVVDADRMLGAVMVLRDISAEKTLKNQLERADRLASLGTMAAGIAHELNNPLAVAMGNAECMQTAIKLHRQQVEDVLAGTAGIDLEHLDDAMAALEDLQASIRRMANIVADIRAFSRPAPRSTELADVSHAIQWAISATAHELRHRARLVTNLDALPAVKADAAKLEQVFINLLLNAAHAITPGRASYNEVEIAAEPVTFADKQWLVVSVRDTGSGIAPEVLGRIFEPFYTTKAVGVGTGLGLSICHGIITALGGHIDVQSQLGGGTVVRVILPVAAAADTAAAVVDEVPDAAALQRARILAVDDDQLMLKALARMLGSHHDLTCVSSARKAVDLLDSGDRFDLILCDLMMPDMTGTELHEEIARTHTEYAQRVVFLTGGAITTEVETYLRTIGNPHVPKPCTAASLLRTIDELLQAPPAQKAQPVSGSR